MRNDQSKAASNLYAKVKYRCPWLIKDILTDLLNAGEYSENDIAFMSRVGMDIVRKGLTGDMNEMSPKEFYAVLKLFSMIFCHHGINDESDF